jgi:diguanylate cyclase (GGDEF)-like protein
MRRSVRLGLLGKFALASVVPILALGLVLSQYVKHQIERRTLSQEVRAAALVARVGLQPHIRPIDLRRGYLPVAQRQALHRALKLKRAEDRVARIKIWNKKAKIVYSDKKSLIGRRFTLFGPLRQALKGDIHSEISPVRRADHASERRVGKLLEVYIPLVAKPGQPPVGAADISLEYDPIAAEIRRETRTMYLLLLGGIVVLYAALFKIVAGASKRLRRQADTLRRQAEELRHHAATKEHQALHDPLTGLPNRVLFADRISQAIRVAERSGDEVAVFLMDLDRFKEVNDTLGHHSGDLLLQELAARLRRALRTSDTVARLGGDEFGVLLPDLVDRQSIEEVVDRIRVAVERPFYVQDLPLAIETSIGVSIFPEHGQDVDALLQKADVAMYVAKEGNSTHELYDANEDEYDPTRLTLVGELRRAIEAAELTVFYQPKADLRTGEVKGTEALVRWEHPERGLLLPDEFIPLAQHTGLIRPLTLSVLDTAMAQLRTWQHQGRNVTVAVNLATRNLLDAGLPDDVQELLDKWQLDPASIEFEITESTIMADPFRALAVLKRLHAMGTKLSIDDFGTGYSSLAYLKRLPVDSVKIDKSFVLNMDTDENDAAIVRSTIDLARNLGLTVVAEGVESETIWKTLAGLGCDIAQGNYLTAPLPGAKLSAWFDQRDQPETSVGGTNGHGPAKAARAALGDAHWHAEPAVE